MDQLYNLHSLHIFNPHTTGPLSQLKRLARPIQHGLLKYPSIMIVLQFTRFTKATCWFELYWSILEHTSRMRSGKEAPYISTLAWAETVRLHRLCHSRGYLFRGLFWALSCVRSDPRCIFLCRHADDTSGLTWGGQTYETSNARPHGSVSTQTILVTAGVDVRDTEVVLVTFVRTQSKRFHRSI